MVIGPAEFVIWPSVNPSVSIHDRTSPLRSDQQHNKCGGRLRELCAIDGEKAGVASVFVFEDGFHFAVDLVEGEVELFQCVGDATVD